MLLEYINYAMRKAQYEKLTDNNSFYGEIPGFEGVYANAGNLENCRKELAEVLEEWLFLRISKNLPVLSARHPVTGIIGLEQPTTKTSNNPSKILLNLYLPSSFETLIKKRQTITRIKAHYYYTSKTLFSSRKFPKPIFITSLYR